MGGTARVYRLKRRAHLMLVFTMLPSLVALGFGLWALPYAVRIITGMKSTLLSVFLFFTVGLTIVGFVFRHLLILSVNLGRVFNSSLHVRPDSLVYYDWPFHRVRCAWEHVERMGKTPGWGASYHTLRHTSVEELERGTFAVMLARLLKFLPRQLPITIPLGGLEGYPDGPLADDLRAYAPHLFNALE